MDLLVEEKYNKTLVLERPWKIQELNGPNVNALKCMGLWCIVYLSLSCIYFLLSCRESAAAVVLSSGKEENKNTQKKRKKSKKQKLKKKARGEVKTTTTNVANTTKNVEKEHARLVMEAASAVVKSFANGMSDKDTLGSTHSQGAIIAKKRKKKKTTKPEKKKKRSYSS